MTKFLKYFVFFAVVALAFTAFEAAAQGLGGNSEGVFDTILDRMSTTFRNVRAVIFVLGGFGLVGLGFCAIFGKVRWVWLGALASGLAIVAIAGALVDYVTRLDSHQEVSGDHNLGDTLYQ